MSDLRAVVVVDYQNVHLTAHNLFDCSRYNQPHESLIDPLNFAHQVIRVRNSLQAEDRAKAVLKQVYVYRGQPSAAHDATAYARNQAQKAQWERDKRVTVTLRPLKYNYKYDEDGRALLDDEGKRSGPESERKALMYCARLPS